MEQIIDWAHDTFLHSIYISPHLHIFVVSLSCGIAISSGRQIGESQMTIKGRSYKGDKG